MSDNLLKSHKRFDNIRYIEFWRMILDLKNIAEKVKERRRLLGIDQKNVAELCGISVHTLSDIESTKGNPSFKTLCKVLDAIGLEILLELKNLGRYTMRSGDLMELSRRFGMIETRASSLK